MTEPVTYYPPKGGTMSITLADACRLTVAISAVVFVLFGYDLI